MKQLPLALSPPPQPRFNNFVAGDNAAAVAHLQSLLAPVPGSASTPAPVYLWGSKGCGKTHLLQAWAAACRQQGGTVAWFEAGTPLPWAFDPACTLVLVDRCDELGTAEQHAAFVLFTEAQTHGLPFGAAGALPPADLPLRDDLRTRLAWGHVFAMQPLSDADTRAALTAEARRRSFDLPDEVTTYLLNRFPRDLSTLMALLASLDDHGMAAGRRLTMPLVRSFVTGVLAEEGAQTAAQAVSAFDAEPFKPRVEPGPGRTHEPDPL